MAAEHTLEDVYAAAPADASERPTGVRWRAVSAEPEHGRSTWPFSTPAFIAALELADDAVVIVDRKGVIQFANSACQAMLASTRLEGARLFELAAIEPRELRALLRHLRGAPLWRGRLVVDLNTHAHAPPDQRRELELSVGAVKLSERGPIHGFSVTAKLVQDKRRMSVRSGARDVFSMLARVAGEVAHDLNNHVAVVLNYSFILLRQLSSERPERAHVEELQQAAWRAAETARLLLRFAGKRSGQTSALDVNEVVREAQTVLALISRNPTGSTAIDQRLFPGPCLTRARRSQLEWLLLELTQRLCTRLGGLGKLHIATHFVGPGMVRARDAQPSARKRILILLEGYPRRLAQPLSGARNLPGDATLETEHELRVGEQLGYELALQPLADNGLRYAIELPGE